MVTILYWPNGDWAFEDEVWKPDPGYRTAKASRYWPDERIQQLVDHLLSADHKDNDVHRPNLK